ncbi:hypothetical protein ASPZODRAFT_383614 [Penicilliopsis zonata CBS 506.65]|uniref:Uncharacterized protein n=1 Tax=Penicilliopsis zonata CBS 506.65 TaxID=1073090 RepID=A0A1L9SWK1_9EURO|nr:hypothetical protein ASPZODRAFT_383614 [Penicilliopsis zonata CBS 506.65]OJJ51423.1 hypothetical protein ASPZODRAFT_383614 [Penicilliopsis zonata CBS 506.65]
MSSPPSPKGQNSSGKGEGRKVSSSDLSEVEHVETVSPEKPEPPALRQPDLALPPFPIVPRQSPGKSGSRPRPLVQFGENAYPPRWFVVQALPQAKGEGRNGEDASEKKGLAQLKWKFDPGPKDRWQGYTKSQLVTYAWNELEEALGNPKMKDKLAGAIRAGVLGYLVENTEDPMPPVPPAPARHEFVAEQLAVIKWASPTPNPSMRDFERPSLAARPGSNLQKLRTMGESAPGSQYSGGLVPKLGDTQSPNDINKEAALAKTSVLRQEVLADDGQPQPAGKYRCLWFIVVTLLMGILLSLFLYSFGIIR